MADPTGGAAGKVAEQMLKEVQEAMKQADAASQAQQPTNVQFNQVLDTQQVGQVQQVAQAQQVSQLQDVRPGNDSTNVLRAATQGQRTPEIPAVGQALDSGNPISSGIHRVFTDVMSGQNKLEEIIGLAVSGRNFSTSELLALQAGVYRFTQELELTSKVVEKGTSAIKQTLNTQV